VLARIEATDRGADEAILLDRDGHVAEATADNVFIVTERAVVTPPTSTNLRGITRDTILQLAEGARHPDRRTAVRALRPVERARSVHVRHHGRSRPDCVG
jgi:branched-subunit amino acid aminotransferase/4-amino-4-deoxychorismate lyase